jgi:SPP1 gp7 family putative phage head morphogenesis protein
MARRKNTFPLHLERMMADLYASALRRMAKSVMRTIKSTYKAEYHNTPAAIKADESFKEMIARLTQEYTDYLTSKNMLYKVKRAEMALRSWSFRTVSDSMTAIKDLKKRDYAMLAIEQAIDSPFVKAVSDNFIKTNMEMLEAAGKEYISGISEAAMNTFINGGSMKDLTATMTKYTDGDVARAELWAQDQMGDAYSEYTNQLHKEAGIDNFVWRTCGDNAVRETHAELEGRVFSRVRGVPDGTLSKPGARLPGQDYRCRCTMEPTLDETDDGNAE